MSFGGKMKTKIKILLVILFILAIATGNEQVLPAKRELSDLEITRVLGLDEVPNSNNVILSVLRDSANAVGGSGENGTEQGAKKDDEEELISVTAPSFNTGVSILQNYTDKQFLGGHVKFALIGESMAKNQLKRAIDFLGRDNEIRLRTNFYIVRDMEAKDFLSEAGNDKYLISEKLNNIGGENNELATTFEVTLTDVMKLIVENESSGVIPVVKIINSGQPFYRDYIIESSHKSGEDYDFVIDGYGIIKDSKLIAFLDLGMSRGYNYIKNKLKEGMVEVDIKPDIEKVVLSINNLSTRTDFDFEGDEIKAVNFNIEVNSDVIEVNSNKSILNEETIALLEQKQSEVMSQEINGMLKVTQEHNADILDVAKEIKVSHPYRWQKIEERWNEIYPNLQLNVNVQAEIQRTYDIIESRGGGR